MPSVVHRVAIRRASAEQFYEVCSANLSNLQDFCPNTISTVELLAGEWGQEGSTTSWSFVFNDQELPHNVELRTLNTGNKSVTFVVTTGDLLDYCNRFKFTVQAMQGVVRWTVEYETLTIIEDVVRNTIESLVQEVTEEIDCNI